VFLSLGYLPWVYNSKTSVLNFKNFFLEQNSKNNFVVQNGQQVVDNVAIFWRKVKYDIILFWGKYPTRIFFIDQCQKNPFLAHGHGFMNAIAIKFPRKTTEFIDQMQKLNLLLPLNQHI
jgi:hypothetical protein